MKLSLVNLSKCCQNLSDEAFLRVIRGYVFSKEHLGGIFFKPFKQRMGKVVHINHQISNKSIIKKMENTIQIRSLKCLSNTFKYFSEIITHNKDRYKNTIFSIFNIEIIKTSNLLQFFNNSHETPH